MPVTNAEIAGELEKLADLLEIEGANPFRVRAYRQAARVVRRPAAECGRDGRVGRGPRRAAGHRRGPRRQDRDPRARRGTPAARRAGARNCPPASPPCSPCPALAPSGCTPCTRRSESIRSHALGQRSPRPGQVCASVPGFGRRASSGILAAPARGAGAGHARSSPSPDQIWRPLARLLRASRIVDRAESPAVPAPARDGRRSRYRRRRDRRRAAVMDRFAATRMSPEVLAPGPTRATVVLRSGLQVDLRVVTTESYGAALLYFTGSKAHSIALRQIAVDHELQAQRVRAVQGRPAPRRTHGGTRCTALGLPLIPPELREDEGEIEAARAPDLPHLVTARRYSRRPARHTDASDGRASLPPWRTRRKRRATPISPSPTTAGGSTWRTAWTRAASPARSTPSRGSTPACTDFTVLAAIEVDILEDGSLDLADEHPAPARPRGGLRSIRISSCRPQADRAHAAGDGQPLPRHPRRTRPGRLINQRPAYAIDMERVMRGALERGCHPGSQRAAGAARSDCAAIAASPRSSGSSWRSRPTRTPPRTSISCASASTRHAAAGSSRGRAEHPPAARPPKTPQAGIAHRTSAAQQRIQPQPPLGRRAPASPSRHAR